MFFSHLFPCFKRVQTRIYSREELEPQTCNWYIHIFHHFHRDRSNKIGGSTLILKLIPNKNN